MTFFDSDDHDFSPAALTPHSVVVATLLAQLAQCQRVELRVVLERLRSAVRRGFALSAAQRGVT